MNRNRGMVLFGCFAVVTAALALSGCQKPAAPAVKASQPTPQESFQLIAVDFRRNVETSVPGFVARQSGGGTTAVMLNNTVSDELIPPASEGEPFRATITVKTSSRVSRVPTSSDEKTKRDDDKGSGDDTGAANTSILDPDTEIVDPSLASSTPSSRGGRRGSRGATKDVPVLRPPDEFVKTYELIYRNGRWDLVTEINLETDSAVHRAFVHALKTQM